MHLQCIAGQANLNTVRFNAFATQAGQNLQTAPGQYDDTLLEGLDRAIAEAGSAGLRIILTLATNWDNTGNSSDTKCVCMHAARPACCCILHLAGTCSAVLMFPFVVFCKVESHRLLLT